MQKLFSCDLLLDDQTGRIHAECSTAYAAHVARVLETLTGHVMAAEVAPPATELEVIAEAPGPS